MNVGFLLNGQMNDPASQHSEDLRLVTVVRSGNDRLPSGDECIPAITRHVASGVHLPVL